MGETKNSSFLSQMGPLLFVVGIYYLHFLARIILSPLMPTVERDLKIGHDEAGSLFLLISLGYCLGLLASGFVSSRLSHRKTILLSSVAVGGALLVVSVSHRLWGIGLGLILVGIAAGLYLPSGIVTVTELVRPEHWGKAMAIHELAPSFAFVTASLLAEALLGLFSWQGVMLCIGIASIIAGSIFISFGRGGTSLGQTPNPKVLRSILAEPSFWIITLLFGLGVGSSFGIYSIIPLYLVSERGMDRSWANTLLGMSRISTSFMVLLGGWVMDRWGLKKTLQAVFMSTGVLTILLGMAYGSWLILFIFLQPMFAACFFSVRFVALSRIGSPNMKNVAISLSMPISSLLGGGAVPAGIGLIGEAGSFSLGIAIYGGLLFAGVVLVRYLKFTNE
jgi:NNP family nitrate/nitrite transporter-like MFS transporter